MYESLDVELEQYVYERLHRIGLALSKEERRQVFVLIRHSLGAGIPPEDTASQVVEYIVSRYPAFRVQPDHHRPASSSGGGRKKVILAVPGSALLRFACCLFSKGTFDKILEPAILDMRHEHFEALHEGKKWKARFTLLRGYWSFWSAVVAQLPISVVKLVVQLWKAAS
ncbi:hypothetical protein ABI59_05230 [Acidobacteria bacterium Mor1]|nr:hypothetical protein ABI59_05230 [Acidobacteria bacterium Mor1]